MSVSSSQGLTSNRIEDLAMRAGSVGRGVVSYHGNHYRYARHPSGRKMVLMKSQLGNRTCGDHIWTEGSTEEDPDWI